MRLALIYIISGLEFSSTAQSIPPSVTSSAGTGTNTSAIFAGSVNPNGLSTLAWFEWTTQFGETNITPATDVGSGSANIPLVASITGLTPGVAYFYQVVATNVAGFSKSEEAIFQTPLIILVGTNAMTSECHAAFIDPGASSMAAPLAIAAGMGFSLAIKCDHTVVGWGMPGNREADIPADLNNVTAIAAGAFHALAINSDGTVVGWGRSYEGQTTPPTDLSNATAIAAGFHHSLALKNDGMVVAWGWNSSGQTNVPIGLSNVVAIAAGGDFSLALQKNGHVVGWGNNEDGELDIPAGLSNAVAIAGGYNFSLALQSDGHVLAWGATANVPVGLSNVVAIAAGGYHSLALMEDGYVIGWGADFDGQASGLSSLTNAIAITAGGYHSLAITRDGKLVVVGYNTYGQTNVPSNFGGDVTVKGVINPNNAGTYSLTYLATNSAGGIGIATRTVEVRDTTSPSLTLLGKNPLVVPVNTVFVDPGATAFDACSGDLSGSIILTGTVDTTALGSNTLTYAVTDASGNTANANRIVITVVGSPFVTTSVPTVTNNTASFTGTVNPNGGETMAWFEWGTNILCGHTTPKIDIGNGLTNVVSQASLAGLIPGVSYHCRIVATNSAGRSNGRDVVFYNPADVIRASAIMLSGANPLTNECHNPFTDPGAVTVARLAAISAGEHYSLALKADGTVAAWGNPPEVPPSLTNVMAIAAGSIHSLALKTDGTVVGWGDNSFDETNTPFGLSNVVSVAAGWGYSLALKDDGTLVGWGTNNFTPAPVPDGLNHVTAIAVGFDLCLALKSNGKVVGWGHPSFGGTIPPDNLSNVVAIAAGADFGLGLRSDGKVEGWGYGAEGQTTVPDNLSNVVAIATGFYHSIALKTDGTVVGWGDDFYGEATPPSGLNNVVAIAAGTYHSLALKRDGTVVGWGMGFYGETDITTAGTNLVTPVKSVTGTVNSNALGSYVLTYRSTNELGKVISIVRKVKVVDTTPPAFVPSPNVTFEFSNELGAKVFFAPKATDLCSTFVKVSSIPRSGTVFPIGTTTVRSRATDASGNSSFCNFQVTVLGAQGVKSNILSELLLARDSLTTPAVFNYLNGAISNLQQSLAPSLWIDQTHLNGASGSMDFDAEASAVGNLTKQMQHNQTSIPTTVFRAEVQRIVRADRLLAMIAFRDFATTRTSLDTLDDAKESLIRGDNSADSGQYLKAIKYYQKAWNFAINGH